ncbi:hypothetical protein HORIV_38570 [Vreelandella olivaria]|uniref:Uncharacterized protein n=1 Tax=Vreelandella olivaria TaxID=390919 RepID=A0ABN5X3U8_9GAMM|nr:hypothetical protein HORIV_38570 [Halomonas olivaria]
MKISAVSIGGTLTLTTMPSTLFAQTSTRLKYDSYVTEHASPSVLDRWFLEELEKRTNGAVEIDYYWAQSLNKAGAHLDAIKHGISEISLISPVIIRATCRLPVASSGTTRWIVRMPY